MHKILIWSLVLQAWMWKAVSLPCLSWWAGTKIFRWARGGEWGKGKSWGCLSVGIGHCWGWEELIWVCRTRLAPSDAAPVLSLLPLPMDLGDSQCSGRLSLHRSHICTTRWLFPCCVAQRCCVTGSNVFGWPWQSRKAEWWPWEGRMLGCCWHLALGWGCQGRAALLLNPGTAVTNGVSWGTALLPICFLQFIDFAFLWLIFSFKDCLCWEKRNHSFKVCICLLWANLRMIHNSLGIWEIRHESIIFFCSFICYKQIHITFILSPHGCILKMIFSLSLSVFHNALISMCQRIAEKTPQCNWGQVWNILAPKVIFFIKI